MIRLVRCVALCTLLTAVACSGDTGPAGPAGTNGAAGADGAAGAAGSDGNNIIISDTAKHGLDISPVTIDTTGMTADQIEAVGMGSYLINAVGHCAHCHGHPGSPMGFLAGGIPFGPPGSQWFSRNLTPDPDTGLMLTQDQFIDVIRTGNDYSCTGGTCTASGKTLVVMPWDYFRWASTDDLKAIYAYLKAVPAVNNDVPDDTGPHNTDVAAFSGDYTEIAAAPTLPAEVDANGNPIPDPGHLRRGMVIDPMQATPPTDPTSQARFARGSYLINSLAECSNCHTNPGRVSNLINTGAYLGGGRVFSEAATDVGETVRSMTANLTGASGFLSEADFTTFEGLIQTGMHVEDPSPTPVAEPMPWMHFRNMTADDLVSIYTFALTVHQEFQNNLTDKPTQDASFYCDGDGDCEAGETCDVDNASATFHECIGRTCAGNSDCRVCQTCTIPQGNTGTCGAPLVANCAAGI